ncbi:branched-chain amino acid transport system ATP-binding protein [Bradyrhizobium sp. i1.3.6]
MSEVLLSVEGLAATYNHAIHAVSDVSLAVRPGEIVAVLGANGAGKSTTLQAVSALLPARRGQITAGSIVFDGRDLAAASAATLVREGIVPVLEGRHCFASLTVEENLVTGAIGRDATRAETADDLDRVYTLFPRLKERHRSLAGLTSGGEQQMTTIGRALMSRPRLLVLDEPSMGLGAVGGRGDFSRAQAAQCRAGPVDPDRGAELDGCAALCRPRRRARGWPQRAHRCGCRAAAARRH